MTVNLQQPGRNRDAIDDDELIAAMAGGDDTALRELFARHAPWLAARLRSVLPAAEVEDVLQESFLAVWRGARSYRPAAVTPWVSPTRPPHDRGGAICACLVVAAGLALITIRGPREPGRQRPTQPGRS
ncbi:MAG TPA: sigma factor [Streptosporangiaceae bacterium]|nr:sigma factor [Streptosporangiaceae bacterium]